MDKSEQKSGMSTTAKIVLGFAITGCLAIVLCCGGFYWFFSSRMKVTEVPAEITQIADSIVTFEVPEGYAPKGGMTMDVVFQMKMAAYDRQQDPATGHLLLMQMIMPGPVNDAQMRQSFDQQLQQQGRNTDLTIQSRETKTFTIDGQPRNFEFIKGVEKKSNKNVTMATGAFPGKEGMVMLIFVEDSAIWDDARAAKLIESMKTGATFPAAETPAEAPAQIPDGTPAESPAETPGQTPEAPAETPAQAPAAEAQPAP